MRRKSESPTSSGSVASAGTKRRRRDDEGVQSPPAGASASGTVASAGGENGGERGGDGGGGGGGGRSTASGGSIGGGGGAATATTGSGVGGSSSSFRNVSACNRCRLRKNRCDQRLPACLSCEKASVRCVGYDPITKREIPRSYVHYLESRLAYLESLLSTNHIPFPPADDFPDLPAPLPPASTTIATPAAPHPPALPRPSPPQTPVDPTLGTEMCTEGTSPRIKRESPSRDVLGIENLVSDIGLVSFAGASDPRYLGSVSGISFARVVFAAVKSTSKDDQTASNNKDDPAVVKSRHRRTGAAPPRNATTQNAEIPTTKNEDEESDAHPDADAQMRNSFFGLHTKPTIDQAPFPSRPVAERLINLYFEHANPQIPSLHRGEYQKVVEEIYGNVDATDDAPIDYGVGGEELGGGALERYMLHIVCAIGAGIFLTGPSQEDAGGSDASSDHDQDEPRKKQKTEASARMDKPKQQHEPEAYHAAAMHHLEAFLRESKGGLEELQAVLLLAGYALLRPVSPGLWYIVGVAVRLAVDLGLHYEDADAEARKPPPGEKTEKQGRKEWVRDMRRRLWWCVYSLDRLVATCVGRPFGIADEVISTQFPSTLDDEYIHPTRGLITPPPGAPQGSYKLVSHHYFRLRLLQSEILQVLQQQSHTFSFASASSEHEFKRDNYKGKKNYPAHHPYHLQTPYLHKHTSLQAWHKDVDRRLLEWIQSAPKTKAETGVCFSPEFLELNYWQAKIMLYRPCLSVPVLLAGELSGNGGTARSRAAEKGMGGAYTKIQDEERVYLVVAEAGSKVLRLYRQLHRVHQVNYTFLATHHLFMAGISFLYAIWHSPLVRSQLSMDQVDFTILAATSVLGDLVSVCPPALACKEAFERMSRATVQMCLTGEQWRAPESHKPIPPQRRRTSSAPRPQQQQQQQHQQQQHQQQQQQQYHYHTPPPPLQIPQPQDYTHQHRAHNFDDGFRELFTSPRPHWQQQQQQQQQQQNYTPSPTTPHTPYGAGYGYHQDVQMTEPQWQQAGGMHAGGMQEMLGLEAKSEWEQDAWSEEGVEGGPAQVDLFDGFFFGGGN